MQLAEMLGTAVGLSMDAFAVALAASVTIERVTHRHVFRFGFHFGLFQALMPVIGWVAGRFVQPYIQAWDHWAAFTLLAVIGLKAIYEALWGEDDQQAGDPTRGWSLVTLSVATSLDALAVGMSFAMLDVTIWWPAVIIGLVTGTLTTFGMIMGSRLGTRFGKPMEILGGLILIAIGAKILLDHIR